MGEDVERDWLRPLVDGHEGGGDTAGSGGTGRRGTATADLVVTCLEKGGRSGR